MAPSGEYGAADTHTAKTARLSLLPSQGASRVRQVTTGLLCLPSISPADEFPLSDMGFGATLQGKGLQGID